MDAVGHKVFGQQWTPTDNKSVIGGDNSYFVDTTDDAVMRKKLVQLLIINALDSHTIKAEISVPDSEQMVLNLWKKDTGSSKGLASNAPPIASTKINPLSPLESNSDEDDEEEEKLNLPLEEYKKLFGHNIRPSIEHTSWTNKVRQNKIDWFRSTLGPVDKLFHP